MAAALDKEIYFLLKKGSIAKDYKLRDQISGSSGSVMDNIAEGFERGGNRVIQFLAIAKGSAAELCSQIHRSFHREHLSNIEYKDLIQKCEAISERINRFINYLNKSEYKGIKYKTPEKTNTN
jgi:four helix bundle protein